MIIGLEAVDVSRSISKCLYKIVVGNSDQGLTHIVRSLKQENKEKVLKYLKTATSLKHYSREERYRPMNHATIHNITVIFNQGG